MDVLSASVMDYKIAWYENDGSENFTTHNITTSAVGAQSVFATDVDGDGDMDVLSASANDDKIAWYENDGSENFTAHTITTSADGANSVFAADVDGDGDMDVLSASANDDKIAWYEQLLGEPIVTTANVTNITDTSAGCGGNVTDEGNAAVTARGVCWNTTGAPTTADSHTTNGSGLGSFTSSITALTSGGQTYYVRAYATNTDVTGYGEQKVFATLMTPPGNALSFDGTDDYVSLPSDISTEVVDNITIEAWVNSNSLSQSSSYRAIVSEVFSEDANVAFELFLLGDSHNLTAGFYDGSWHQANESASFPTGEWVHVAATYDGHYIKLYRDGTQVAISSDLALSLPAGSNVWRIGRRHDSGDASHLWNGKIDDVSIWNVTRSQSDIQNNMHKILNGDESNLVAYYHFDHTSGTALSDRTTNDNDGTLENMTDDDWVTSTAPFGEDGTLVLTQDQTNIGDAGKQMQVTITTGGDASNYLGIYRTGDGDSPISDETFPGVVTQRSDILWGIKEYGTVTASLVIDYSNVVGITDPSAMQLLKRTDAGSAWTNVTGDYTRDDSNRTFSKTGVTDFSEFSIGDGGDNSLPVELSSFTATCSWDGVILKWRTETEVNNVGFGIYRSEEEDGDYTKMGFVNGAGNSAMPKDYEFTDNGVEDGKTYFYYLEDVDMAGTKNSSDVIKVVVRLIPKEFHLLQNFPNPFNPDTWIPYELPKDAHVVIEIYNIKGHLVRQLNLGHKEAGYYVIRSKSAYWDGRNNRGERIASGVYFYRLQAGKFNAIRRMVILK